LQALIDELAFNAACVNRKVGHRVHREGGQGTLGASA
jgi:hypothetical protein